MSYSPGSEKCQKRRYRHSSFSYSLTNTKNTTVLQSSEPLIWSYFNLVSASCTHQVPLILVEGIANGDCGISSQSCHRSLHQFILAWDDVTLASFQNPLLFHPFHLRIRCSLAVLHLKMRTAIVYTGKAECD